MKTSFINNILYSQPILIKFALKLFVCKCLSFQTHFLLGLRFPLYVKNIILPFLDLKTLSAYYVCCIIFKCTSDYVSTSKQKLRILIRAVGSESIMFAILANKGHQQINLQTTIVVGKGLGFNTILSHVT